MMNHPGYHGSPHFQTNPDKYMVGLRHNIIDIYIIYIFIYRSEFDACCKSMGDALIALIAAHSSSKRWCHFPVF